MSKHEHLARARDFLASDDDVGLRYAALELRLTMETIVYDKLRLYAPRLPAAVLEKWQPPQAMKALTQLEPHASQPFQARFARQPDRGLPATDWKHLGEHRTFEPGWLRTNYHKLGNFLHEPTVRQSGGSQNPEDIRAALNSIADEVERISAYNFDGSLASVIHFECAACDRAVFCNEDGLRKSGRATCLESSCSALHARS